MKESLVTGVAAIEIMCEDCEELCVNSQGSQMITFDNKTVKCEYCKQEYSVPASAFRLKERERTTNSRR